MKNYTIEQLKKLEGMFVTLEILEELEENEFVEELENCGASGYHIGMQLYCLHLVNGDTVDIYY